MIKFPDVSVTLNFSTVPTNLFIDFPLAYRRDSVATDYLFPHGSAQWMFPVGRLAGMNVASRPSFRGGLLDRLSRDDPNGLQQVTIFKLEMEMKKFTNAFYDPTVTLSALFGDESALAPQAPNSVVGESNIALAAGLPVGIVLVLAAATAFAFVLSPKLRSKVAPFLSFKDAPKSDTLGMEDGENENLTSSQWRPSTVPSLSKVES